MTPLTVSKAAARNFSFIETVLVVFVHMKMSLSVFLRSNLAASEMSLDRAMTHRPTATGPSFGS